jgi:hypothetical protein
MLHEINNTLLKYENKIGVKKPHKSL